MLNFNENIKNCLNLLKNKMNLSSTLTVGRGRVVVVEFKELFVRITAMGFSGDGPSIWYDVFGDSKVRL